MVRTRHIDRMLKKFSKNIHQRAKGIERTTTVKPNTNDHTLNKYPQVNMQKSSSHTTCNTNSYQGRIATRKIVKNVQNCAAQKSIDSTKFNIGGNRNPKNNNVDQKFQL